MKRLYILLSVLSAITVSCDRYLDERPDKSLAMPNKLQDLQAILDYENIFNMQYPAAGDIAADYYFLNDADWESRNIDVRNTYVWNAEAQNHQDWSYTFQRIFHCNVVLDEVDDAQLGSMNEADRKEIKGRALFYRGWNYFNLSQLYAPFYEIGMPDAELGLPLKLKADINEPVVRSTLEQTYERIIEDLTESVNLLPDRVSLAIRPSRAAAMAALAKVYLIIGDYDKASVYADSCLQINNTLLDYNDIDVSADLPFEIFNPEVIFHAVTLATSGVHAQSRAFVDSTWVAEYAEGDLRKSIFLKPDDRGLFRFKGSYEGGTLALFSGIALDEIYLVKAESLVRTGENESALNTLNQFLRNRWDKDVFEPLDDLTDEELLTFVLAERRRQLLFRGGIRWSDLRRLNKDPRYSKKIFRSVGGTEYTLEPNDNKYTFLLPIGVVEMSGVVQNPR